MSGSAIGSTRRASALAALVLSVGAALWLAFGPYHLQPGLEGMTALTFKLPEAAGAGDGSPKIDQLRQAARAEIERGLSDEVAIEPEGLSFSQDLVRLNLYAPDEKTISRFLRRIGPADLRFLAVRHDPPALTALDRSTLDAQLANRGPSPSGTRLLIQEVRGGDWVGYTAFVVDERPLVTSADVDDAVVENDILARSGVTVRLKAEAARRFEAYTAGHVGDRVAIVVDGEVLMAPVIEDKMSGDAFISNLKPEEAAILAGRLRSSVKPSLVLLQRSMVGSYAPMIRTLASVLGALAVATWLFAMVVRQQVSVVALSTGISSLAVGLAASLSFGAVLIVSFAPTLVGLAVVAALTVLLLPRRGGPAEGLGARLAVSWPGLVLLAAAPLVGLQIAGRVTGPPESMAMAGVFAGWPVLITTGLGVMAVASRPTRD